MKRALKIIIINLIFLLFSGFYIDAQETVNPGNGTDEAGDAEIKEEKKDETVKRRIKWEDAEGATEYRVQISNSQGKIIINKTVSESSFDIELPYGEYHIRIGAVNKFGKIGSWSDWANVALEETKDVPKLAAKSFVTYTPMFLKLGIGPSFFVLFPDWNDLYKNSYNATTMYVGAAPFDFPYLRYSGIEFEGTFAKFKSKSGGRRINSEMKNIITGLNLFARSWFDSPVNAVLRLGGGAVFTEQKFEKFNTNNIYSRSTAVLKSNDPYYKAGLSVEYRALENLYLEAGADFYLVRYLTSELRGLKYFIVIGTGL
ncbi:MAG: fibronectin type III domain-containing protein [Spirochaetes bacterium]|jgi:hypothetical protein|nr:fibronectin type III domain-containing protein [Spirochaetota bacterium]